MRVVLARENLLKSGQSGSHRYGIRVVSAAMEHLVVGNEVHDAFMCAEGSKRKSAADRLGEADHVWDHAEIFRRAAPTQLGSGLDFVENQQRPILIAELP